jgi:hypothetical protein
LSITFLNDYQRVCDHYVPGGGLFYLASVVDADLTMCFVSEATDEAYENTPIDYPDQQRAEGHRLTRTGTVNGSLNTLLEYPAYQVLYIQADLKEVAS